MILHSNVKAILLFAAVILLGINTQSQVQQQTGNNQKPDEQVTQLTSGTTSSLYAVCSSDSLTAFAAGAGGTIIKTIDGGKSWKTISTGTSETLWSLFFTDKQTGYVAGSNGTILKTMNSGSSWTKMNTNTNSELKCIYFSDASTGYAAGINGTLIKTVNGGASWEKQTIKTEKWLKDIFFTSKTTGYVCGWGGNIFQTKDGGTSWELLESTTPKILESLYFPNAEEGYAVGWGGTVIKTTDGGESWAFMSMPNTNDLTDLCMVDADHLLVVGYTHTILSTINDGEDWVQVNANCSSDFFDIAAFGSDAVLVVGSGGKIMKIVLAEKLRKKELKKYWSDKEDAYDAYILAEESYKRKEFARTLVLLDSATTLLGKDNISIQEMRIKCYNDQREYAATMKEINEYLLMKPDTSSEFYKQLGTYSENMEKKISDETDWRSALADSTTDALEEYLKAHPNGIFKNDAKDESAWLKAKETDDPEGYDEYLKNFKNGKHAAQAEEYRTYYMATRQNNPKMYEDYFRKFPQGKFINEISDTLRNMYMRMGEAGLQKKNPGEAEQWFKKYEQAFSENDTTDYISKKMDEVELLRKEIADEQEQMRLTQQKNKLENDLKWEKGRRDKKLVKAVIFSTVTVASAYGAYYFYTQDKKLFPAITLSSVGIIGLVLTKNAFQDVHFYQQHVHKIKGDIKNLSISALFDPVNNLYGMTLQLKLK
jgi:photosystem II stability/assembly factor-like uncharacterized protein